MSVRSTYNNFARVLVLPENFKFINWGSISTINMQPAIPTTELTANVYISHRYLTRVGRCVGCSWIQLDFTGLHRQSGAIARGDGEVIWPREVSQCQLQWGAPAALLNHAVQLQLRGPEHLTLIWAKKGSRVQRRPPKNMQQRQLRQRLPWPTSWISVTDSVDIFCTAACHNETNVYLKNSPGELTCPYLDQVEIKCIFCYCGHIVPSALGFTSLI